MTFAKKDLSEWELAKTAARCPRINEARMVLGVSVAQFCELINVSRQTYWTWASGEKEPTLAQKILIVHVLDTAQKKGFIGDKNKLKKAWPY